MRRLTRTTLAAAITLGATTAGLASTAVAATPATATQHVTIGSQWVLTDKYACEVITFEAGTFTGQVASDPGNPDAGTWNGGRRWLVVHVVTGPDASTKGLGTYSTKTGGYVGHITYEGYKTKATLVPGSVCDV